MSDLITNKASDFQTQMIEPLSGVVSSGDTESTAIEIWGTTPKQLITPTALTSTTITFKASLDGTNYFLLTDPSTGLAITFSVAASKMYPMIANTFSGIRYLKIICASAEAADRTFTISPFSIKG